MLHVSTKCKLQLRANSLAVALCLHTTNTRCHFLPMLVLDGLQSQDSNLLVVPRTKLQRFGDGSFRKFGSTAWNYLPPLVRLTLTGSALPFKKRLRTHLCQKFVYVSSFLILYVSNFPKDLTCSIQTCTTHSNDIVMKDIFCNFFLRQVTMLLYILNVSLIYLLKCLALWDFGKKVLNRIFLFLLLNRIFLLFL